jgi:hypothetical protein
MSICISIHIQLLVRLIESPRIALASRAVVQHLVRKKIAVDAEVIATHLTRVSSGLAETYRRAVLLYQFLVV